MIPIGQRGYHVSAKQEYVEIRMYKREFSDPNQLIATNKLIKLTPTHISELKKAFVELNNVVKEYQATSVLEKLLIPLGSDGLHLSANMYCDQVLVHIRYFDRCFWDPDSYYPTKIGITMKLNEVAELESKLSTLTAAILP
jgi:hypothetical protein